LVAPADRVCDPEPVLVFEELTEGVPVRVRAIVPVFLLVKLKLGDADIDFVPRPLAVIVGLLDDVLDPASDRVKDGLELLVLLTIPVTVDVLDEVPVFVPVLLEVSVFVPTKLIVARGDADEDFDTVAVFVEVIVFVCDLVLVDDGVISRVGGEDLVVVVIFVEVFDMVAVVEGKIPNSRTIESML
jgi:hypothetical protein